MEVPLHDPLRYWPPGQLLLEQVEHPYPLLLPEHDPYLYCPPGQLRLEHE